jgi:hypothetical protein
VWFLESDELEAELVFQLHRRDANPILVFAPIPGGSECVAARLSVRDGGLDSVEYGSLDDMKKHVPSGLNRPR